MNPPSAAGTTPPELEWTNRLLHDGEPCPIVVGPPRYALADPSAAPPLLTIVTPFFNAGEEFDETAASVLGQSLQQFEWLIVDDGSDDPTSRDLLTRYESADPRIRVIRHDENRGLPAARNTGFANASTDYVLQLDSDDLLEPTAAEKLLWFLDSYPEADFVKGHTIGFGAESFVWVNGFDAGVPAFVETNRADATALVRTRAHEAIGGYDEGLRGGLEDWAYWLRHAGHGNWGGTIPEPLNWVRRRLHHADRWPNWGDADREKAIRDTLLAEFPQLSDASSVPSFDPQTTIAAGSMAELTTSRLTGSNRLIDEPRVLLVVPWLAVGGTDTMNRTQLQALSDRGWASTIVATRPDLATSEAEIRHLTPDVFRLPRFLPESRFPEFVRYLIESRRPNVVVIDHSELGYLLIPYLRAHFPDLPIVDKIHLEAPWRSGGYPRFSLLMHDDADLTISVSDHLRAWMIERGAAPDRVRTIYHGVDTNRWAPDDHQRRRVRDRLGISHRQPVILYGGRLVDQKQPDVFLATLQTLADRDIEYTSLVFGAGARHDWLRREIEAAGLADRVHLVGETSPEETTALMQASDVYFLPSKWEGIAITLYEAMACGLAVVGADVGGQSELVTPDTGILLQPQSASSDEATAYADALADLVRSRRTRTALGGAARARIEAEFGVDRLADELERAFAEAAANSGRRPPVDVVKAARVTATLGIEMARMGQQLERTRRQRPTPTTPEPSVLEVGDATTGPRWARRVYYSLARAVAPLYRWAARRRIPGVGAVRRAIRRLFRMGS